MSVELWTYILVGITFAVYLYIGYYNRVKDTGGFYVAGRGVPAIANGAATGADWMSAASFISMAGLIAFMGYGGSVFLMGWTGGYVLLAMLLAPYLRKFGKFTVSEFIGERYYSKAARMVAVLCLVVASITYVIGQMKGVGVAFGRFLEVDFHTGVGVGMARAAVGRITCRVAVATGDGIGVRAAVVDGAICGDHPQGMHDGTKDRLLKKWCLSKETHRTLRGDAHDDRQNRLRQVIQIRRKEQQNQNDGKRADDSEQACLRPGTRRNCRTGKRPTHRVGTEETAGDICQALADELLVCVDPLACPGGDGLGYRCRLHETDQRHDQRRGQQRPYQLPFHDWNPQARQSPRNHTHDVAAGR